jgi:hypothetical protein
MDTTTSFLEILKYILPALVVLLATYLIVQKFVVSEVQRKQLAIFQESQDVTIRLRLQAYERLTLFIERISPRQLITRLYDSSMTVRDLQMAINFAIRTEYEHNLSQQIYVSKNVWETVKGVKEQEMNMANRIAASLPPDAHAKELHARILDVVTQTEEQLPTDVALQIINDEVRKVMAFATA